MKVLVANMSQTGNNRKIAEAIYEEIECEKEIKRVKEVKSLEGYNLAPMVEFILQNPAHPTVQLMLPGISLPTVQALRRTIIGLALLPPILLFPAGIGRTGSGEPPRGQPGTQGMTYYVAPTGSDTYPGTEVWPWRTIQKAANTLVAGDTIYIKAGTYPEQVVPQNSGSAGSYITYCAYPGDTVTIDGSGVTLPDDLAGLFHISNRGYIVVSGLGVTNVGPHNDNAGILVLGSSNIVVESNRTYNTNSSGIGVWGSSNVTVDSNRIEDAGGGGWQECIGIAGTDTFQVRNKESQTWNRPI